MAHYDVVPVDESDAWTYPPFEGRIEDGWVYGRGALDDKGPLAGRARGGREPARRPDSPPRATCTCRSAATKRPTAPRPPRSPTTLRERGIVPWLVLDEGGAVVDAPLPFALGSAAMVGVGEKGVAHPAA